MNLPHACTSVAFVGTNLTRSHSYLIERRREHFLTVERVVNELEKSLVDIDDGFHVEACVLRAETFIELPFEHQIEDLRSALLH